MSSVRIYSNIYYRKESKDLNPDEINCIKTFFSKIANYCFEFNTKELKKESEISCQKHSGNSIEDLCLTDLIGNLIYDELIEGIEYQVITPKEFFSSIEHLALKSEKDYKAIEQVLKFTTKDVRWFSVRSIEKILETFGVREHKPRDTNFLKYSLLEGRDIRILNRLIHI